MGFEHKSVLLEESIEGLHIKENGIYVDGTLGGAGHAYVVCSKLGKDGRFVGIDQDDDAIAASTKKLEEFGNKVSLVKSNYCNIENVLKDLGIEKVDGILLDLGVSSHQLDTVERGFSYRENAPLDMRMDRSSEMTAKDIVNDYSEFDLYRIIRDYGEDKFAKNIAKHIVRVRQEKVIETTDELTEAIKAAIPMRVRMNTGHPAKKTFQAIRIELNQELEVLRSTLNQMINLLDEGGRMCVITFHSLEDRIVKNIFRDNENPCICPPRLPICSCGKKSTGKIITRKPIIPSQEEIDNNKRSKSSKLRVFERHIS